MGAKLLTGAAWSDALCGLLLRLISFTLLTFILFNPLAASAVSVLPSFDKIFSSGARLLTGWALADIFHVAAWRFLLNRGFHVLSFSVFWSTISVASLWLIAIVVAWWLLG